MTVEQYLQHPRQPCIDVRSPSEYIEAHIPDAVSLPLFSDAEREEIGTLYKQQGADVAKWRAMEIVSPKIPQLLQAIRDIVATGAEPVIYCWRGGMRSKAVALFASMVGLPVSRLSGGFKSYRHYVLEHMGAHLLPATIVVLHGLTGIGKTELLDRLTDRGWPVLDLEKIANHRGSVFGDFGHWQAHNQKMFDALLFQRLQQLHDAPLVIIEAESKRIGKAVIPDFLMEAKENGVHVLLTAPISTRVDRTFREYVEPYIGTTWLKEKAMTALLPIQKRMSKELRERIESALEDSDYKAFIHIILEHYYDPMYAHKQEEYDRMEHVIDIANIEKGLHDVEAFLQRIASHTSVF